MVKKKSRHEQPGMLIPSQLLVVIMASFSWPSALWRWCMAGVETGKRSTCSFVVRIMYNGKCLCNLSFFTKAIQIVQCYCRQSFWVLNDPFLTPIMLTSSPLKILSLVIFNSWGSYAKLFIYQNRDSEPPLSQPYHTQIAHRWILDSVALFIAPFEAF